MRHQIVTLALALSLCATSCSSAPTAGTTETSDHRQGESSVQLGPRPFFLVNEMEDGRLKRQLQRCTAGPFKKSDFSIGHRGAALQFPEHTRESYEAGARLGAGILECDVTFTKDKQLVCRHAQNDLHTTTNILVTPLAEHLHQAVHAGRARAERPGHHTGERRMPHERDHAGRVQDADRQDGRVQPGRSDAGTVPRWNAQLPHRRVRGPDERAPADVRREHRVVQEAWRQDDARAQVSLGDDAVQRLHAGNVCAEDDRRAQGRRRASSRRLPAVIRQGRRSVLDQERTGLRPAGGVPR